MLKVLLLAVAALLAPASLRAADVVAPGPVLRAVYIRSNLAQAAIDPATGAITGVSADIAREIARRTGIPVAIAPLDTAAQVLEAVRDNEADIGFVAPNPDRTGVVLYSRPYMLVQQSALVRTDSAIASVTELDRPGRVIGVNTGDSVGVWLRGRLSTATLRASPDTTLAEAITWFADGTIHAFAGNRQRLRASTAHVPTLRLLPDNLYGVPQTVAVRLDRPDRLAAIQAMLDAMRDEGTLARFMDASGVDGIALAP